MVETKNNEEIKLKWIDKDIKLDSEIRIYDHELATIKHIPKGEAMKKDGICPCCGRQLWKLSIESKENFIKLMKGIRKHTLNETISNICCKSEIETIKLKYNENCVTSIPGVR